MKKAITDKSIKWPDNVIYGTKKFYLMNKKKDLTNIKHNILNYYCINHIYKSNVIKMQKNVIQKYNIKKKKMNFN